MAAAGGGEGGSGAAAGDTTTTAAAAAAPAARRIRVYTRTGDKGTTALFNGSRGAKDDDTFHALGTVDELNSVLGVAREHATALLPQPAGGGLCEQLVEIQSRLLDVGAAIATPIDTSSAAHVARVAFDEAHVAQLEAWIDAMDDSLPPLKNFILPGGGLAAAHLHVARTTCRRAERTVVPLVRDGHAPDVVQRYLNRLSDYCFVAARFAAAAVGGTEAVYKKSRGLTPRPAAAAAAAPAPAPAPSA